MSAETLTGPRQFRCGGCGRAVDCTPYDLLVCRRTGWPTCCGRVMEMVVEGGDAGPSTEPRPAAEGESDGRGDSARA